MDHKLETHTALASNRGASESIQEEDEEDENQASSKQSTSKGGASPMPTPLTSSVKEMTFTHYLDYN